MFVIVKRCKCLNITVKWGDFEHWDDFERFYTANLTFSTSMAYKSYELKLGMFTSKHVYYPEKL